MYIYSFPIRVQRPLVVTGPTDGAIDVIREAGELASRLDVPLQVLTVITQEEYENEISILLNIDGVGPVSGNYSPDEYAESIAKQATSDLLSDLDLDSETIGVGVGKDSDKADAILETAERNDSDYVFIAGQKRSPTGKAVFGDTAQRVILNYDGAVVVKTD